MPAVFTTFSPMMILVFLQDADVIELVISQTKHLEKATMYKFLHGWLREGLLTSKGDKWQKRRKILTPAFHFSILLEFVDVFNKECEHFCKQIMESKDKVIDIVPIIENFTLSTMIETSLGKNLDFHSNEGSQYKNILVQLDRLIFMRFMNFYYWMDGLFRFSKLGQSERKYLKALHAFTVGFIRKRESSFQTFDEKFNESYVKRKHPLLDILLNAKIKHGSIDEDGIREEVDTFVFEGHDTTAQCLNFTTMLMACHKEYQEEARQEITNLLGPNPDHKPTYADLQKLHFLERFIKESLRLYPPVPFIGRKTSEDIPTKFGTIPKGVDVHLLILDIQRNPKVWPNPEVFDPSRHLPENSKNRNSYAFIPFSAGPRNCIGQRYAMLEIKAFFCETLRRFVLEPIDRPEDIVLIQSLVLRPRDGIKVKFSPLENIN
ncbi:hypothetical protein ABEB36_004880 [Hypothenemus hampei]